MTDYPSGRGKFWANKLIRLLQKSCAANEIGIEACWLVTCVALVEDAKHYSGPVTFWTGQLLPITGFHSWGRLDRARVAAVAAGWLHYRPGTNRQSGVYWTLIPEQVSGTFTDSPVDEVNHQNGDRTRIEAKVNHQNGDSGGDRNVIETGLKRDIAVNLPSLFPEPVPEEEGAALPAADSADKSKKRTADYPKHFEAVWTTYPEKRRTNKRKTFDEYQRAVKRVADSKKIDRGAAVCWLLQRVTDLAASHYGQNYPPESHRWFQNDRYDDSPEAWQEFKIRTTGQSAHGELWRQVVKACLNVRTEDAGYLDGLRAKFGDRGNRVVAAIRKLGGVNAIKGAAEAAAKGKDFGLSGLEKRFGQELEGDAA